MRLPILLFSLSLSGAALAQAPSTDPKPQPDAPSSDTTAVQDTVGTVTTTGGAPDAAKAPKHPTLSFATAAGDIQLDVMGQYRPRAMLDSSGDLQGNWTLPLSHRVRFGAGATWADTVRIFASIQDVRVFGEEVPLVGMPGDPTLFGYSAAAIDVHEAYAQLTPIPGLQLKVGRQEIAHGTQRILGAVDWTQQGRSFDGATARLTSSTWGFAEAMVARVQLGQGTIDDDGAVAERWLGGAQGHAKLGKWMQLQPLLLVDTNGLSETIRSTLGTRVFGQAAFVVYDVEAYHQMNLANNGVSHALLGAAKVGVVADWLAKWRGDLFVDVLSGNQQDGSLVAFDTLFATNHKFYGLKDLFLNIPLHTKGKGLVDAGLSVSAKFDRLSATMAFHVFAPTVLDDGFVYGVEPDVVITYKVLPRVAVQLGMMAFAPIGNALERGNNIAPQTYLQMNAAF